MQKKTLSEIDLYFGQIEMPKDFEIDREILAKDILYYTINKNFLFSKSWDMLNTYLRENIRLKYNFSLINKDTIGDIYAPGQASIPFLQVDPIDLKNSPDYVMLYGVNVEKDSCKIFIEYSATNTYGGRIQYYQFVYFKNNLYSYKP
jgi:hypothetical protein